MTEVEQNPDLYVTYHYFADERKGFTTTHFGYGGFWDDWFGWGGSPFGGTSVTREYSFTEGTLVIDAYDAAQKKMVWRGSGTATEKTGPEKRIRQVEKILTKMGKRWDRILDGRGR